MMEKYISARKLFEEWGKDPKFRKAYEVLEEEFALAEAFIRAGAQAELPQELVEERVGTTQVILPRLKSAG